MSRKLRPRCSRPLSSSAVKPFSSCKEVPCALCPDTCGSDGKYHFRRGTGPEYVWSPDTSDSVVLLTKYNEIKLVFINIEINISDNEQQ